MPATFLPACFASGHSLRVKAVSEGNVISEETCEPDFGIYFGKMELDSSEFLALYTKK